MATYNQLITKFQREPILLVKITVDSPKNPGTDVVFRFSQRLAEPLTIQLGSDVRPYLQTARGRATRISSERALTERARITLMFFDDENAPDFDSAEFNVTTGLSFWGRLVTAQPNLIGSPIEILRGFIDSTFVEASFQTIFKGRFEDIDFQSDGRVRIIAKDNLTLVDRQVPSEISDTNTIASTFGVGATTFTVDDKDETTDPDSIPSKDYFPLTIRLDPDTGSEEDVLVKQRSASTFTIQDNFADDSENFDPNTSAWTQGGTATATVNTDVGPFGGPATADTINFPANLDQVAQLTAASASAESFVFSVWLKKHRSITTTGDVQIQITDGTTTASVNVTPKSSWRRFEVTTTLTGTLTVTIRRASGSQDDKVVAYGAQLSKSGNSWTDEDGNTNVRTFYVATSGNAGAAAGRAAYGTTDVSHTGPFNFREIIIYRRQLTNDGVNPTVVMRDLVNRGEVANTDIDLPVFDREFEFVESQRVKRFSDTTIDRPRNLLQHVQELTDQLLLDVWIGENGKVRVKYSWRINIPDATIKTFTDADNIIVKTASYRGNSESRITRVFVYYNLKTGEDGDKPEDFSNVEVIVDLAAESIAGPRSKSIFSKYIFRSIEAQGTAGRLVSRFKRGARIAKWSVDIKDDPDFFTGDFLFLDSRDIPVISGSSAVRGVSKWQVTQKDPKHREGRINVEALEARGLRYAIISPSPTGKNDPFSGDAGTFATSFLTATDAEKQFGFIGDANNKVGSPAEDGYFIL